MRRGNDPAHGEHHEAESQGRYEMKRLRDRPRVRLVFSSRLEGEWAEEWSMLDDLKCAIELAQRRPDDEQRMLAHVLLETMEAEERWSALLHDPHSPWLLDRLVAEALAEDDAGDTEEILGEPFFEVQADQTVQGSVLRSASRGPAAGQ